MNVAGASIGYAAVVEAFFIFVYVSCFKKCGKIRALTNVFGNEEETAANVYVLQQRLAQVEQTLGIAAPSVTSADGTTSK